MKEKFQLLIKNEGLTQSRLADMLEIQPANISHIISGRSKPGFELLQKILRRFPRINPDWLLLDSDQMYRKDGDEDLESTPQEGAKLNLTDKPAPSFDSLFENRVPSQEQNSESNTQPQGAEIRRVVTGVEVERVVVLFSDGSFKSYNPRG